MINLLPPEEKERIKNEKKRKMAIIYWFLTFFFIIVLTMVLCSLQFYLQCRADYQKVVLSSQEKLLEKSGIENLKSQINESNKIFKNLSQFYKNKYFLTDAFYKIFDILPSEIHLNSVNLSVSDENLKLNISGFSPTREILFDFRKKVEEAGLKNINFPASNWVKANDITFFISFDLVR
jgi:hypothetical protein